MSAQLPVINSGEYVISDTIWTELTEEIQRLRALIASDVDMDPSEVTKVKALAKQVRDYGVKYRREITTAATSYKNRLDEELKSVGYDVIETYIDQRKKEQQQLINTRLNNKLARFNDLVRTTVGKTNYLKQSPLANFVSNNLASRFPKLNSGAESKEITNWAPIESVVNMSVMAAEKVFEQYPILMQLPATSKSLRAISSYLETGDVHQTENIRERLEEDKPLLQRLAIERQVDSDDKAIDAIQGVLASSVDNKTKLSQIKTLLEVYQAV